MIKTMFNSIWKLTMWIIVISLVIAVIMYAVTYGVIIAAVVFVFYFAWKYTKRWIDGRKLNEEEKQDHLL